MSTEERFRAACDICGESSEARRVVAGNDGERYLVCATCATENSTEAFFRADRLADLCAAYREACDTSDYPDASPPRYQAAARFRAAVNPDDVCAVIDELGERR